MSHGHGLCVERVQQQRMMHSVTDDDDDGDGHVECNAQRYYLCSNQPEQHNKKQVRRSMFGCCSFYNHFFLTRPRCRCIDQVVILLYAFFFVVFNLPVASLLLYYLFVLLFHSVVFLPVGVFRYNI